MLSERKSLQFELKASDNGEFAAVFSSFDVIDLDGDVTRPGAFKDGAAVVVGSWGHKTSELPVGKATIRANAREASIAGGFFLDTTPGRDTYATVKALGDLQEWSYVFVPTKVSFGEFEGREVRFLEQIDVWSVDPVLKGAGIDTRTTDIKSITRELPFLEHSEHISALVEEYAARVKERAALREKEGRVLSTANVGRLQEIAESLKSSAGALEQLLADAKPEPPKSADELVQAYLRFQRNLTAFAA